MELLNFAEEVEGNSRTIKNTCEGDDEGMDGNFLLFFVRK